MIGLTITEDGDRATVRYVLPCCGTTLTTNISSGPPQPPHGATRHDIAKYWAEGRAGRHKCELVWEGNPFGLFDKRDPLSTRYPRPPEPKVDL